MGIMWPLASEGRGVKLGVVDATRTMPRAPCTLSFVGGRTVNRRNRDVRQAQVHAELAAVVDHVVENEAAKGGHARHREHLLPAALERPTRGVLRVASVHPRARLRGRCIELLEDGAARR